MILISNDDGYQAKGIQFLINIVKDYDDVKRMSMCGRVTVRLWTA